MALSGLSFHTGYVHYISSSTVFFFFPLASRLAFFAACLSRYSDQGSTSVRMTNTYSLYDSSTFFTVKGSAVRAEVRLTRCCFMFSSIDKEYGDWSSNNGIGKSNSPLFLLQSKIKAQASVFPARCYNGSAMELNGMLHDGKSEPRTAQLT